jgi:hypothetical protein
MGTATLWRMIMLAWSYKNNLAIPQKEDKTDFVGGLSRLLKVGYSTNGYLVIEDLLNRREKVDKVMIFTDTQLWNSKGTRNSFEDSWNQYKSFHPSAKLYIFDLAGYGRQPLDIRQNDVYLIAGWSDKIFDVLNALEDKKSAVEMIKKVVL